MILNILREINIHCTVIEKLHPSENGDNLYVPEISSVKWQIIKGATPLSLMWHSSIIIGMRSMALLQSALMGIPTASYQPNLLSKERCTAVRLNLIPSFGNIFDMKKWLKNYLTKDNQSINRGKISRPFFSDNNLLVLRFFL